MRVLIVICIKSEILLYEKMNLHIINSYDETIRSIWISVSVYYSIFQQLDGYVPGQDYPIYAEIPQGLSFRCDQRLPGYYSDPEAQCQVTMQLTIHKSV